MPSVDAFAQFLAEEAGKEGSISLIVVAPRSGSPNSWCVGTQSSDVRVLQQGTVVDCLNDVAKTRGYTHKDLHITQPEGLVTQVARKVATLELKAPRDTHLWTAKTTSPSQEVEGFTMEEALMKTLESLSSNGAV